MAVSIQNEIETRSDEILKFLNDNDVEAASRCYLEDAVMMPHGADTIVGRAGIKEAVKYMKGTYHSLKRDETQSVELLGDNTAYSNFIMAALDEKGNKLALMHDGCLWRKVDGVWYISRIIFNSRPMSKSQEETTQKRLTDRLQSLYDCLSRADYGAAATYYTDNGSLLPHDELAVTGRSEIARVLRVSTPRSGPLAVEEVTHCELLAPSIAHTEADVHSVGPGGVNGLYRDSVVWKRIDGEWFIHKFISNGRPMPK